MNSLIDLSAFDLPISRNILNEYFGVWAISADPFNQLVNHVNQIDIRQHIAQHMADYDPLGAASSSAGTTPYLISGGVAQIEMIGPMMKYVSSLSSGVSTVYARKQIRHAVQNDEVSAIFLRMDSPGGTVSGTKDLADEVARAVAIKPVIAFIDDLSASANYWIASQCTEIIANNSTALIGSIGTYAVIYDFSKQAESLGIKTYVIGAGKFKGSGVPGTEITAEHREEYQRVVDSLNNEFTSAVSKGRSLASGTIDELADGRVHPANVALDLGLIDRIETFDSAISRYYATQPRSKTSMSAEQTTVSQPVPQPATMQQLEGICAEPTFVLAQLKAGATVSSATAAYNQQLKAEVEQLKASREIDIAAARKDASEKAQQEATETSAKAGGVRPIATKDNQDDDDGAANTDVVALFEEKIEAQMSRLSNVPDDQRRRRAVIAVAKSNPALHQSYLAKTNEGAKRKRLLAEKYDS